MTAAPSSALSILPRDWARRPVTDPEVFEPLVDLIVLEDWRAAGALVLLLCHQGGRLLQPIVLAEFNAAVSPTSAGRALSARLGELREGGARAAAFVIARPGLPEHTDRERELGAALGRACASTGVELLGIALAVPGRVVRLPNGKVAPFRRLGTDR